MKFLGGGFRANVIGPDYAGLRGRGTLPFSLFSLFGTFGPLIHVQGRVLRGSEYFWFDGISMKKVIVMHITTTLSHIRW